MKRFIFVSMIVVLSLTCFLTISATAQELLSQTQGVVTASEAGLWHVFIQDGEGPWNGLSLWNPPENLEFGDLVEVAGVVSEFYGLTQIWPVYSVEVISRGTQLPEPQILETGEESLEQWESVLIRYENVTVTNPDLGYGEWEINDGTGSVIVDDNYSYSYIPVLDEPLDFVTGPLDFSYGNFKVQPRENDDIGFPKEPHLLFRLIQQPAQISSN